MDDISYKRRKNPIAMKASTFKSIYNADYIAEAKVPKYSVCKSSGKNCYSYSQAHQKLQTMKFTHSNRNKVFLRIYRCESCNSWHLTSCKGKKWKWK